MKRLVREEVLVLIGCLGPKEETGCYKYISNPFWDYKTPFTRAWYELMKVKIGGADEMDNIVHILVASLAR